MNIVRWRFSQLALPVLLLVGGLMIQPAAADNWVEPKFAPPVGSKWLVQREVNVEKNERGTMIGHTLKQTALLTVEEKTADGYVMTYDRQSSSYDGDPAGASRQRIEFAAMQGIPLRFVTDAAGKPLRIVNFADLKALLKQAIDAQPISTADPEALASLRRVADRMASVDDKKAAALYLDELPLMAIGQNTGLQPGEVHRATLPVANALIDGVTKVLALSIAQDDLASGKVRYLMTETFDPDSMKALVSETFKELALTNVSAAAVSDALKTAVVAGIARAQLDVAGGMTRELRRQWVTSFRGPGGLSVTSEDELVTISPATE
jgi:hypothetical protein